jgi:hypothetical protein
LIARVDQSPFGSHAPGRLDRAVLAMTRSLPANWLGLRLAILLRRIVTMRPRDAFDIELWGLRLRLHPLGNGCEKNALFTPQMYDVAERNVLAQAIDGGSRRAEASPSWMSGRMSACTRCSWRPARARARASLRSSHSPELSIACASTSRPIRT